VKKSLRRIMPDPGRLLESRYLRVFGKRLHDPSLWHLNRRSASGAFAVGLFMMYMPPVGQMLLAAAAALVFRVNLPISVALVWLCNPLTIPPMFYFAYRVGARILGTPPAQMSLDFWTDLGNWGAVLAPLSVGMLVCATVCSAVGWVAVQGVWRWSLMRQIRRRRARYRAMAAAASAPAPAPGSGGVPAVASGMAGGIAGGVLVSPGVSTPSSSRQT
jgi:uncharacterized protein (DUF2062 family)